MIRLLSCLVFSLVALLPAVARAQIDLQCSSVLGSDSFSALRSNAPNNMPGFHDAGLLADSRLVVFTSDLTTWTVGIEVSAALDEYFPASPPPSFPSLPTNPRRGQNSTENRTSARSTPTTERPSWW